MKHAERPLLGIETSMNILLPAHFISVDPTFDILDFLESVQMS